MPSKKALELCPTLIFISPRFEIYKAVSLQVRAIFYRYTDLVEPLSLDEAYLDVTEDKQGIGSALDIATLIKTAIREELQLSASAGVSINKFVAKIASDLKKPGGLTFIGPSRVEAFVEKLSIEKFYGVGKVTAAKMKGLGIHNGADLKTWREEELVKQFGKVGRFYYHIVRGIDERPVKPNQQSKSIGAEDTFAEDLTAPEQMKRELEKIAVVVNKRLTAKGLKGRTVTLKIKYHDFRLITRSKSFPGPVDDAELLASTAVELLQTTNLRAARIRLLGITVSNFYEAINTTQNQRAQLPLFDVT